MRDVVTMHPIAIKYSYFGHYDYTVMGIFLKNKLVAEINIVDFKDFNALSLRMQEIIEQAQEDAQREEYEDNMYIS